MKRKDDIAIAKAISAGNFDREALVNRLCKVFKEDNPRFDAQRFKKAAL